MSDDVAKVFAGHLGVAAVLANVLIDTGVISREELCDRFRQAQDAASRSVGGPQTARILAAMLAHLEKSGGSPPKPQ